MDLTDLERPVRAGLLAIGQDLTVALGHVVERRQKALELDVVRVDQRTIEVQDDRLSTQHELGCARDRIGSGLHLSKASLANIHVVNFFSNAWTRRYTFRMSWWWLTVGFAAAASEPPWDFRDDLHPVAPRVSAPSAADILKTAHGLVGTPYSFGGVDEDGYDCSGFVNHVFAEHGYDLPRTSREQFRVGLIAQPGDHAQPGDLLFFASTPGGKRITHVGIAVDADEFIHASSGRGEVTYDRLSGGHYQKRYVGARRILSLPPGRYSTFAGLAQADALYATPDRIPDFAPTAAPSTHERAVSEHASRPRHVARGSQSTAITQLGPRAPGAYASTVSLQSGLVWLGQEAALLVAPEVSYFDPDSTLAVRLGAPLAISIADRTVLGSFGRATDALRLIQSVRFGQKEAEFYVEAGRTLSGTLGHGALMRYFTPALRAGPAPDLPLRPEGLSLALDYDHGPWAFELFLDDVLTPAVFGARFALRPAPTAASYHVTYVGDPRAPAARDPGIHGLGFGVDYMLLQSQATSLKTYADLSSLLQNATAATGLTLGSLLRIQLRPAGLHALRLRLEGTLAEAGYSPSYFDSTYAWERLGMAGPGTAKLERLRGRARGDARVGAYGEVSYHLGRRVAVGGSYALDVPWAENETNAESALVAFAELRDLYLPRSHRPASFYLAYHAPTLRRFSWLFREPRPTEYFFASALLEAAPWLALSLSARKGLAAAGDWAGLLSVRAQYLL